MVEEHLAISLEHHVRSLAKKTKKVSRYTLSKTSLTFLNNAMGVKKPEEERRKIIKLFYNTTISKS